eukprot:TRINITY_DN6153_c1_g1_i3.p1 TRINITY_DN6153_c1_g1~~TRINITY_DN6153_c1_g1_i3.p1  ORF type:complete len:134 (+),score=10.77 TRINITY_DN6153_c1_g1_i3:281-682(+)
MVAFLIANGAQPDAGKIGGWLPIHAAISISSATMTKMLILSGANVNSKNLEEKGYSPLHMLLSKSKQNIELLTYLLNKKADPNIKNTNGNTPLHLAALFGLDHVINLLVSNKIHHCLERKNYKNRLKEVQTRL